MEQLVPVSFAEFLLNIIQKLVHVGELEDLLIAHHEDQLKLVVQLELKGQILVVEELLIGPFLEDDGLDERVDGGDGVDGRVALEEPQHDPAVTEYREYVQHFVFVNQSVIGL